MLRERFQLTSADVYEVDGEVDYTTLFEIAGLPIPNFAMRPGLRFSSRSSGRAADLYRDPGRRHAGASSL